MTVFIFHTANFGLLFSAEADIMHGSDPGVAQLVGRLVWELEHQNGSTSRNVGYSPLTSQIPLITSVESWAKLW